MTSQLFRSLKQAHPEQEPESTPIPVVVARSAPADPDAGPLSVSAVIPLLDEKDTLAELHRRLSEVLESCAPGGHEIIFVDDGSRDGSGQVLEEIVAVDPNVVVVQLGRQFGKTAALAAGCKQVRGDIVLMLDADLQDVPEEVPKLLAEILAGADLVTGRKQKRQDPWTRRAASRVFNRVVSLVTGTHVRDVNSGFKAMRREVVQKVPLHGELHRYLPVLAHSIGFNISEVDVDHEPRRFGRSRYGLGRYIVGLLDTLMVLMLTRYSKTPLHFFGVFGLLLSGVGAGILTYLSVGWFLGNYISNRPLFSFGVLMLILGVQSLFFGILAEMITISRRDRDSGYRVRKVVRGASFRSGEAR